MENTKVLFDAVIRELNTDYNTIENASKIFKRQVYKGNNSFPSRKYLFNNSLGWSVFKGETYIFDTIFGSYTFNSQELKLLEKIKPNEYGRFTIKSGIEILGMKPERTKDGKYTYKGQTIKELKDSCKKNGIKNTGKMDKCELVKMLLKC